jgi:hypothetical protein
VSVPAGGVCLGNVYRDGLMCVLLYVFLAWLSYMEEPDRNQKGALVARLI